MSAQNAKNTLAYACSKPLPSPALQGRAMNREDAAWFVEQHVFGPAVRRVTRSRLEAPFTACVDIYFSLASALAEEVIQTATSRIVKDGRQSITPQVDKSIDFVRIQMASEVAKRLVKAAVSDAIDAALSRQTHHRHHHKHVHQHHQSEPEMHGIAVHVVLTEIMPEAMHRVQSSCKHQIFQQLKSDEVQETPNEQSVHHSEHEPNEVEELHRAAELFVAKTALAAIASVIPTRMANIVLPTKPDETAAEPNPADDVVQEALPSLICAASSEMFEAPVVPSPVPAPAEVHKSSPRRKKHGVKTKVKLAKEEVESRADEEPVEPSAHLQSVLPPLKLPASPRASSLRPLIPVQSPPRTARTAAAVIVTAPPPDQGAKSPVMLPPVVTSPRSSTSHSTLTAIYHPKPPPQPHKSRPEPPPELHAENNTKRTGHRRTKDKEKKPKIPSGFCQRCALDGRACKLRDCLKHQPPLRPPPGNRRQHLIES